MKYFSSTCLAFLLGLPVTAAEPQAYNNARSQPGEALGMAAIARELAADSACLDRHVVATVNNVSNSDAPGVENHFWTNSDTKIEMVDHPSLVNFYLSVSSLGCAFNPGPFHVIDWTTDYASNTTKSGQPSAFGHKFRNHREAVMARPLSDSALICFQPPLQDQDGKLTKWIIVLPSGTVDALAAVVAWRSSHHEMFKAKEETTDYVVKALRAELANANAFTRLAVMVQLMQIGKLQASDVSVALKASRTSVEIAAATILVIRGAPEIVSSITDALVNPEANRQLLDGVAMGAATHFLQLADSERLVRKAQSFQIVRATAPNLPDALNATVSFPLLLKLADSVTPKGGQPKLETSSMLFKMLKASAAIP